MRRIAWPTSRNAPNYHGRPGDGSLRSHHNARCCARSWHAAVHGRTGQCKDRRRAGAAGQSVARDGADHAAVRIYEMLGDVRPLTELWPRAIGHRWRHAWATVMTALAKRAHLRMNAGDLAAAEDFIERAEEHARELWRFDGFAACAVRARNQRSHRDPAGRSGSRPGEPRTGPAVAAPGQPRRPWLSVDALLNLSRAYLAVSDPAGAQLALREAEHIIRRRPRWAR